MLFKEVIAGNSEKHTEQKYMRWEHFLKIKTVLVWVNTNISGVKMDENVDFLRKNRLICFYTCVFQICNDNYNL